MRKILPLFTTISLILTCILRVNSLTIDPRKSYKPTTEEPKFEAYKVEVEEDDVENSEEVAQFMKEGSSKESLESEDENHQNKENESDEEVEENNDDHNEAKGPVFSFVKTNKGNIFWGAKYPA